MRISGIALIAIVICITGNYFSSLKVKRVKILECFLTFIGYLRTQIEFSQQPLERIFEQAVESNEFNDCGFLKMCLSNIKNGLELSNAWKSSVDMFSKASPLTNQDCRTIKGFSNSLGSSDIGGQIRNCEAYSEILKQSICNLKKSTDKAVKIINTLSLFLAAFVIIFFI